MVSVSSQAALGLFVRRLERIGNLSNAERHAVENLPAKVQTLRACHRLSQSRAAARERTPMKLTAVFS